MLNKFNKGNVLIFSLVILMILTLLAISASTVSIIEQKVSGNLKDRQIAEQAAIAAIEGITYLLKNSLSELPTITNVNNANPTNVLAANLIANNYPVPSDVATTSTLTNSKVQWLLSNGVNYFSYTNTKIQAALTNDQQPKIMIQEVFKNNKKNIYKIVALARGNNPNTFVIKESSVTIYNALIKLQCDPSCTINVAKFPSYTTSRNYGPYSNWLQLDEIPIFNIAPNDRIRISVQGSGNSRGFIGQIEWQGSIYETNLAYYSISDGGPYEIIPPQHLIADTNVDKWYGNKNHGLLETAVWLSNSNWHGEYSNNNFTYQWLAVPKKPAYLVSACEGDSVTFNCPVASQTIKIVASWYGSNKENHPLCSSGTTDILTGAAGVSTNPTGFISSINNQDSGITLNILNTDSGIVDPAPGLQKYAYFYYTCQ